MPFRNRAQYAMASVAEDAVRSAIPWGKYKALNSLKLKQNHLSLKFETLRLGEYREMIFPVTSASFQNSALW